ncbi:hypothetical protein ACO0QE_004796 [Hanseniaspora vineae]
MFGFVNRQNAKPVKPKKHTSKLSNRNAINRRRKKREFISLDSYIPSVQGPIEIRNAKRRLQKNEEERLKIRLLGINSFVPIGINKTLGTILQEREEEKEQMEAAREEEEQFQRQLEEAQQAQQQAQEGREVEEEAEQTAGQNHTAEYYSRTYESTTNSDVNMNIDLDEDLQEQENDSYGFGEEEVEEEEEEEEDDADDEKGIHNVLEQSDHEGDFEEHEYSRVHLSSESSGHMQSGHVLNSNPDLTHEFESFSREPHSMRVNRSEDSNNNHFGEFLLSEPSMFPELGK